MRSFEKLELVLFLYISSIILKSTCGYKLILNMKTANIHMKKSNGLVWFKNNDLRIRDNLPLVSAHKKCENVFHVYVIDPRQYRQLNNFNGLTFQKTGIRRFMFLYECLVDLQFQLTSRNSNLNIFIGEPETIIPTLISSNQIDSLYLTDENCYEELSVLKKCFTKITNNVSINKFWGTTLIDPNKLPFQINNLEYFTSFRKAVESSNTMQDLSACLDIPQMKLTKKLETAFTTYMASNLTNVSDKISECINLYQILLSLNQQSMPPKDQDDINAYFSAENLSSAVRGLRGGELSALRRLDYYVNNFLKIYKETRNGMIGPDYSSKFSLYLAYGTISAKQIYHYVKAYEKSSGISNESTYWLIFELLWRDYMKFYSLKYKNKLFFLTGAQGEIARNKYPWKVDPIKFKAWTEGKTGYPIIDANMRELNSTGFMSNRGRQIVASFLVRDMELDWRLGAQYFEEKLIDYDVDSNWGNWQYAAGVGSDPREDRYFNIVKQTDMYDPDCEYIRLHLPELTNLPVDYIKNPQTISREVRIRFNLSEEIYPTPIVPLKFSSYKATPSSSTKNSRHGGIPAKKKR